MFDPHPLTFYIRYLPDPTPRGTPLNSEWFHLTPIHTILDERLGILRVTMKPLLNTTLLFLLVIGFSGGASGQDFEEIKRLAEQGWF